MILKSFFELRFQGNSRLVTDVILRTKLKPRSADR